MDTEGERRKKKKDNKKICEAGLDAMSNFLQKTFGERISETVSGTIN